MYALIIAAAAMTAPAMQDNPAGDPPVEVRLEITDTAEDAPCAFSGTMTGRPSLNEQAWSNEAGFAHGHIWVQRGAELGTYVYRVDFNCQVPIAGTDRPAQDLIHTVPNGIVDAGERRLIFGLEQSDAAESLDVFITVSPISE